VDGNVKAVDLDVVRWEPTAAYYSYTPYIHLFLVQYIRVLYGHLPIRSPYGAVDISVEYGLADQKF
jgi:hypothetical protein